MDDWEDRVAEASKACDAARLEALLARRGKSGGEPWSDDFLQTPLMLACMGFGPGQARCVEILLRWGFEAGQRDAFGLSAWEQAGAFGAVPALMALARLFSGPDAERLDHLGEALVQAAQEGRKEACEFCAQGMAACAGPMSSEKQEAWIEAGLRKAKARGARETEAWLGALLASRRERALLGAVAEGGSGDSGSEKSKGI